MLFVCARRVVCFVASGCIHRDILKSFVLYVVMGAAIEDINGFETWVASLPTKTIILTDFLWKTRRDILTTIIIIET